MAPKVSILTAVYNSAAYLHEAVESILEQSFRDFEFIIVDDASTDATAEILDSFTDSRIVRLQNGDNLGLTASLNRALEIARGDYVSRQDGDDISLEHRLTQQVTFLDAHPDVGVLGTQMDIMDASGEIVGRYELPQTHGLLAWNLFFDRSFAHPTVMMRRQVLQDVGGYDESYRVSQDFDLWTRLIQRTRFANLPDVQVLYRNHKGALGHRRAEEQYNNVLRARHALASRLLDTDFPLDLFAWIEISQQADCDLLEAQKRAVLNTILRLEEAFVNEKVLSAEDAEEVHADVLSKVLRVGRCGQEATQQGGGLRQSIGWGLSNPGKALAKVLRRGEPAAEEERAIPTDEPGADTDAIPGLSVVVLSYERMEGLQAMLESLSTQELEGAELELLLVNNSPSYELSQDGKTPIGRLLNSFDDVKLLNSNYNWSTASRYATATLARNETILFLDDDLILQDPNFVSDMYKAFQELGPADILSCWNELWVAWDENQLHTVSLDFQVPGITQITPTDTCGPGISMFNKTILQNRTVQETVMRPKYPKADDMGFALVTALEHKGGRYYFPAKGRLAFHDQKEKGALDTRSGRYQDLLALYKDLFKQGYTPVLERLESLPQPQARLVEWAAENLPVTTFEW
ncbi:MAG: glycosyltransferase [Chloroflexi bacterium]|nr:MAG: glycosyltransferase [Chloroflexota bacterium]MBL1193168.1 glycosyltransferase [Chloroflexota bacterium]NOH10461.1 glycosyltransferase [Chloroflexota bacterium]